MLRWLRRGLGKGQPGLSVGLSVFDEIWHPSAGRAREIMEAEHNLVVRAPIPGDRLLEDGILVCRSEAEPPAQP